MNSKKVILIFPLFSQMYGQAIPDRPPLGILTLAGPLLKKGYEVVILDERAEKNFDKLLIEHLNNAPICAGLSVMSVDHLMPALRISKLIKDNSKTPVIWGGIHASLVPESTLKHELIDIIVRDDGEDVFPLLLECLANNRESLKNIPGIGYKLNGLPYFTDLSKPIDIASLPPLPFHLIDLSKYQSSGFWVKDKRIIPIETSRGCPYSCTFCTESVRKKKWRALSPERVISDLKHYIKTYQVRNFAFIDDYMFADVKRGEKILDLIINEKLDIKWSTNMRPDFIAKMDKSFIKKLEQSGCSLLTFGNESGSERILKMINKKATVNDILEVNNKLSGTQIIAHYVTIVGFPTETLEDITKSYLLNIRLKIDNPFSICHMPFLIATPGTKMAELCLKEKTDGLTLEEWHRIIDKRSDSIPEWVLPETFDFIKKYQHIRKIIARLNDFNRPFYYKHINRVLLKTYKLAFLYGFSDQLENIIKYIPTKLLQPKHITRT